MMPVLSILPLTTETITFPHQSTTILITNPSTSSHLRAILTDLTKTTQRGDSIILGLVPLIQNETISPISDRSNLYPYGTAVRLTRLERITSLPSLLTAASKALTIRAPGTSARNRPTPSPPSRDGDKATGFILYVEGINRFSIDHFIDNSDSDSTDASTTPLKAQVTYHDQLGFDDINAEESVVLLKELKSLAKDLVRQVALLSSASTALPSTSSSSSSSSSTTKAPTTTLAKRLATLTTSTIPAATLSNVAPLLDSLYSLFSTPPLPSLPLSALLDSLSTLSVTDRIRAALPVLRSFSLDLIEAEKRVRRIREWTLLQEMGKIRDELMKLGEGDEDSFVGRLAKAGLPKALTKSLGSNGRSSSNNHGASSGGKKSAGEEGDEGGDGEGDEEEEEEEDDVAVLTKAVKAKAWSKEAKKVALRELKKLKKTNAQGGEYGVIRNYLEMLLSLPWVIPSASPSDATTITSGGLYSKSFISRAAAQLDEDHFGMEKVKKRLLEWLVVLRLKEELALTLTPSPTTLAITPTPLIPTSTLVPAPPTTTTVLSRTAPKPTKSNTPILLLLGPPGTGKTSIAKSLALALDKPFTRISLGGVRDEASIRGFLRTYVGAMPGNILDAVKRMGSREGVILLDEIDKLSSAPGGGGGNGGNPEAALLEVLDPGQNESFVDRYLGIPFDLSKVLFIATANSLDGISAPLLDRMEVIEIGGYVHEEKLQIALRYLLPAQLLSNGLPAALFDLSDPVLLYLITNYTREAGVRGLDRLIGAVVRGKVVEYSQARDLALAATPATTTASSAPSESALIETSSAAATVPEFDVTAHGYSPVVSLEDLIKFLGNETYGTEEEVAGEEQGGEEIGVALGLAYMGSGNGGILHIESILLPGSSSLTTTGSLGPVIIESAQLAFAWIKSHAYELGLVNVRGEDAFKGRDVHLHLPSGGVKKDGPSAGVAFTVAIVSLMKNVKVNPGLAMTGEITLRGTVGAVGGIREKVLAAHRQRIRTLMLPATNSKDVLSDLPTSVKDEIKVIYVKTIWEALEGAFGDRLGLEVERRVSTGGVVARGQVESRL